MLSVGMAFGVVVAPRARRVHGGRVPRTRGATSFAATRAKTWSSLRLAALASQEPVSAGIIFNAITAQFQRLARRTVSVVWQLVVYGLLHKLIFVGAFAYK